MSRYAETNPISKRSPIPGKLTENLRLFVAITVDDRVRQRVAEVSGQLKASLGAIRWVARENLHLTLKFLGPVEQAKVASIADTLAKTLADQERFSVRVKGLGVFPNPERARILWAGLVSPAVGPLVERVEEGLEPLGFGREQRTFRQHLTLGRWRVAANDPSGIRSTLERRDNEDFGEFMVHDISLFQSTLYPKGPVYSVLKNFHLKSGSHI